MSLEDRNQLSRRWNDLLGRLELMDDGGGTFDQLFRTYSGAGRHYHDIHHIASSLQELDGVREQCQNPDAIELAIWFHDCVYDGRLLDNEEKSAEIARKALLKMGADAGLIQKVRDLILATRHLESPVTQDERVIADIDLAPLGAPIAVFDANGESIRREYAHLNDEAYGRGRREILQRFLDRAQIYATETFASRYERQARANLARSISGSNGKTHA